MNTKEEILARTVTILAHHGYAGTSMRKVAAAVGIEASVIYNHFSDKESLLRSTREYITQSLRLGLDQSSSCGDAGEMLRKQLHFQLKNREKIVALLQYFMSVRHDFPKNSDGYVPERAYQHMMNIITAGAAEGKYSSMDISFEAKAISHMINGFLLEYFDRPLDSNKTKKLVNQLAALVERSLGVPAGRNS